MNKTPNKAWSVRREVAQHTVERPIQDFTQNE